VSPRRPRRKGGSLKDGERRQIARAARHGPAVPPPATGAPRVLCDGGSRGNPRAANEVADELVRQLLWS
jgi:hypothetical protein